MTPSLAVTVSVAQPGAVRAGRRKFTCAGDAEYCDAVLSTPAESWIVTVLAGWGIRISPAGGAWVSVESREPKAATMEPGASAPGRKVAAETAVSVATADGAGPEKVTAWYRVLPALSLVV